MPKRYVNVGDKVRVRLPWSEVCMHMGVAGREMFVRPLASTAQLIDDNGREFSFPITLGEAGFYTDSAGIYTNDIVE